LAVAREQKPDLILLDMLLPKMTGPDVLKALKKDPATAGIAVVVFTDLSQKNATRLQQDGVAHFWRNRRWRWTKDAGHFCWRWPASCGR
jgi:CheY-like chemotaxis protein